MKKNRYPYAWKQRIRMMGVTGFLFFFVKGLLWLSVPSVLTYLGMN